METPERVAAIQKTDALVPEERHFILSTLSPSPAQKRLAVAVVLGISVIFIAVGLLSGIRTTGIDSFMTAYLTALFVCDSITAILLFAQFSILRLRSMLVLANAYLFTALVLIPYALTFPGVFAPIPEIGGLQSAAYLFILWHCGFPLFVIAYALSNDGAPTNRYWATKPRAAIAQSAALTAGLVLVGAFLSMAGGESLPRIMLNRGQFSPLFIYLVALPVALLSTSALALLWVRKRSMLDLWLMVVMFVFLIEMPTSYYPDPRRFSPGWYAARLFGFLGSSLVLIVLLYEIQTLYARLLGAVLAERREREARLMTGDAVAASIAHEVRQPLTAMVTTADAGLRFIDRAMPNLDKAREAFRRIVADGHRAGAVVASIRANFRNDVRDRTRLDVNELIQEALALGRRDLQKHRIRVQVEANKQLPEVQGNRVQLQQVLLNLIMNAIDAMAAGEEPRILTVKSEAYESDGVMVSIADTGTGIVSQEADRIFNPLFTTKSDGMGMGLSICRAIIEAHEGRLWFAPNTPSGAVFQFTLQADNPASAAG
jgi:signal transduction histidine kinase